MREPWAIGRDQPDTVITDPDAGEEDGVRLDVVVDTAGVDLQLPNADRVLRVEPVCPGAGSAAAATRTCGGALDDLPRPIELGTSLVWSGRVPVGTTWEAVVEWWPCDGACEAEVDGTPPPGDRREPRTCRDEFDVRAATVVVVGITAAFPDDLSCGATVDGPEPRLTVPPEFTLRERYPWTCGLGAVDPGDLVPSGAEDEQADIEARACMADLIERGGTAELPIQEIGPADDLERSWWRTRPEGGFELILAPPYPGGGRWYALACTELLEDRLGRLEAEGCDDQRELSVVHRSPTEAPATTVPPTSSGSSGADRPLVVVFADAGDGDPTIADRWVLVADGTPRADGPLSPAATVLGTVDLPTDGELSIRWDRVDCADACAPSGPDGLPISSGTIDTVACEEPIPPGTGPVVARFQSVDGAPGGATCGITTPADVPVLTVPPAWSLRERYPTDCGAEGEPSTGGVRECLVEAAAAGRPVEAITVEDREGPGLETTVWRVTPDGVTVTGIPAAEGEPWLQVTCASIELGWTREPALVADDCGPEEVLGLDPP